MSKHKKIVLSEENLESLIKLAEMVDGEKEVAKDPNFALSLLFSEMKKNPSHTVMGVLLGSLDPDVIEDTLERAARDKAA